MASGVIQAAGKHLKSVVKDSLKYLKKNSQREIYKWFLDSVDEVNQETILTKGFCKGMKFTFCEVVWDLKNRKVYYSNIGDSRIYEWSNGGF